MTNEELSSILSPIYNYANELDSKGQGVATIGINTCNSADLVKYNILNLLLYISTSYNTNDLDLSIISGIVGYPVTEADIANHQANTQSDISLLSIIPESFVLFTNADKVAGIKNYENSSSQTLVLLYELLLTQFFKCSFEELQQKNVAVYNYINALNTTAQKMLAAPSNIQQNSFNYVVNPETGEVQFNRTGHRSRGSRRNSGTTSDSQSDYHPPTISQPIPTYTYPEPQQKKSWVKPVIITAVVLFILGLLLGI